MIASAKSRDPEKETTTMSSDPAYKAAVHRETALECLRLAIGAMSGAPIHASGEIVPLARTFYDFTTGADRATLVEEAKAAIEKLAG